MGQDRQSTGVQFGRYRLIGLLAEGGMAEIHLASQTGPGGFEKLIAIKRIRPEMARDERFTIMLFDEARLAANLNHPNVVQIFDLGLLEGRYFIAMEFLLGENLHATMNAALERGARIPPALVAGILMKAAEGLHHAHTLTGHDGKPLYLVHRDVCPQNIFVQYDGVVKVVDFGIAWGEKRITETRTGVLKGKLAYMSPEQIRGGSLDARSDVFSLGVVLWECLAGKDLFHRKSDLEILEAITQGDAAPLHEIDPTISVEWSRIAQRALARDRKKRYRSAAELQSALAGHIRSTGADADATDISSFMQDLFAERIRNKRRVIDGAGEHRGAVEDFTHLFSDPGDVPTHTQPPKSRSRLILVGLAAVGMLLAAVMVGMWLLDRQDGEMPGDKPETQDYAVTIEVDTEAHGVDAGGAAPAVEPAESRPSHRKKWRSRRRRTIGGKVKDRNRPVGPPGKLRLKTTPWTEIYYRGRKIGETPLFDVAFPPGVVKLRAINREKGIDGTITVLIKPGEVVVKHHSFP